MIVVGALSGTSADGIDVAVIDITIEETLKHDQIHTKTSNRTLEDFLHTSKVSIKQIAFDMVPWSTEERDLILRLCSSPQSNKEYPSQRDVCIANFTLGESFSNAILQVLKKHNISLNEVALIGSHGQTIWHEVVPNESKTATRAIATLQIGEPAVIAERTGITTVGDFRVGDVAAGGNGAPLMAAFDWVLLRSTTDSKWRAIQNIGGIGNVTFLPPMSDKTSKPMAFDTGPGNVFLNWCIMDATNNTVLFDEGGQMAKRGAVNEQLLNEMLEHPYFQLAPPKTTGRELWTFELFQKWKSRANEIHRSQTNDDSSTMPNESLMATLVELTAASIAEAYRHCPGVIGEVLISGGGSRNTFLMERIQFQIQKRLGLDDVKVTDHESIGINSDAKEAFLFALLAYLTVHGVKANVPACTGATTDAMLGKIIPGQNFTTLIRQLISP